MERGQGFDSIRDLSAGVPCAGKYAHEQLSAGRVIVGYQDSLGRFLAHLSSVIRKQRAAKLYFFVVWKKEEKSDKLEVTDRSLACSG